MTQLVIGLTLIAVAALLAFWGQQLARDGWTRIAKTPAQVVEEQPRKTGSANFDETQAAGADGADRAAVPKWLKKGTQVTVILPIPPGLLLDQNRRPTVLTFSFDQGEQLTITDETTESIELSDRAKGKGWLKKAEAPFHLKPTP